MGIINTNKPPALYIPSPRETQLIRAIQERGEVFSKELLHQAQETTETFNASLTIPELEDLTNGEALIEAEFTPEHTETSYHDDGIHEVLHRSTVKFDLRVPQFGETIVKGIEDDKWTWFTDQHVITPEDLRLDRPYLDSVEKEDSMTRGCIEKIGSRQFELVRHHFGNLQELLNHHLGNFFKELYSTLPIILKV